MKFLVTAAVAASLATIAAAATTAPLPSAAPKPAAVLAPDPDLAGATDARSVASDQAVGVARRAYRAQCNRYASADYCDCVTAGVAQALTPADVRLAARTIRSRMTAEGDAAGGSDTDLTPPDADAMSRIEQVEGHYADACSSLKG